MATLGYLAAAAIGITLGLMGGGGSILTVPVLVYLFHAPAQTATAYSLFLVGVTALVGALSMARRGLVDLRAALLFALPAFVSVAATPRWLLPSLPERLGPLTRDQVLLVLFALLMLVTAVSMLRRRPDDPSVADDAPPHKPDLWRTVPPSLAVGVLTGLVGAGGGFLIVPALVFVFRLPMKRAVGTSLLVIAANSAVGFLSDTTVRPHADWGFLAVLSAIAVAGILVGERLSRRIPAARLRPAFGVFLLAMGSWMVLRELL
mgnify:CR=1 FL=1